MRNSDTPQKGDKEGNLKAKLLLGDSVNETCLV